jgi:hypothetical protein
VVASVFACAGTGLSRPPPRRRYCGSTAPTPGTRENLLSSSTSSGAAGPWLAAGSQTDRQQALRDFARAMAAFFDPANPAARSRGSGGPAQAVQAASLAAIGDLFGVVAGKSGDIPD